MASSVQSNSAQSSVKSHQGEECNKELKSPAQQCVSWALNISNYDFISYLQNKDKVVMRGVQ